MYTCISVVTNTDTEYFIRPLLIIELLWLFIFFYRCYDILEQSSAIENEQKHHNKISVFEAWQYLAFNWKDS